ncbi:HigA family addiction module antidote protein [Pseudomonas urmiensis]|jgi:addiction module HigA family antidote|uniref:HigA family addiction module antidote protein n=1 Tax=Pseudomonas urmiensis TaxID=2745493 RepID=A0ABW8P298_9PSED|nr:HigA family addiction module antitoxin [Pseudomonas sp.]
MPLHNPPHPGETLREEVLPTLGLTVKAFAAHLGFSREALSRVLHGRAAVSPDLALRLEMAGVSTARLWLAIQADYDLWQARNRKQPVVERLFQAA